MKVVGHRGARGLAPENTIASLKKAIEHGADEIEIDVRVTKNGVVILHHDAKLSDRSGQRLSIKNSLYADLKRRKPDLTTLEEAIEVVNKRVPLQIEVKPGVPVSPVVKTLKQFIKQGWREADFLLGSKSQTTLNDLHRQFPSIQKVVIESWSGIRAHLRARQVGTKLISINKLCLWPGYIRAVKRSGYYLYSYTVNDLAKAKQWQKNGLDAVVTDYPDRFDK